MRRKLDDDSSLDKHLVGQTDSSASGAPLAFPDVNAAHAYLHSFKAKGLNMQTLRATLAETIPAPQVLRLTDDEVLKQVAFRLSTGHFKMMEEEHVWRITDRHRRRSEPATFLEPANQEEAHHGFAALSPSTTQPLAAQADTEEHVDAVAQARTLMQAAQEGKPFCEACEKARRERQAAAA